jgi:UDP-glucose 4-epimerase
MVLPSFVNQAIADQPLTIFGSGDQSRCFGHVSDVVDGLVRCISSDSTVGQVFNLGNTEEVTINALAYKVIESTGSRSTLKYLTYDEAYGSGFEDMQRRVPDIAKAYQSFGYRPTKSLDYIVEDVVAYCRKTMKSSTLNQVAAAAFAD